jgi:hypothetical protein
MARPAAGAQGVQARSNVAPNVRGPAASATSIQDGLPSSLPGTWTVHLCIAGEQSWIRLENAQSGEFHTLSYSGQSQTGIQWDLDVQREIELKSIEHIRASVTVQNPRIFRGATKARNYGLSPGNCAGFTRDAWYFYSGEWYPLPSPPSAAALRELVLRQHPEQPAKVYSVPREQSRQTPPNNRRR